METSGYNLWQLFAGVGLFLFGMQLMEQAIRHLAGRSFKIFLRDQTSNPLKAIAAGLVVTAVLQSSSIVNLLVLAFVGARILNMHNALAILLGSNLGSTVYNWIVVFLGFKFDIQSFAFPILALSAAGLIFFQENKRVMHWTRLSFGLSLLFLGLANIKSGVETLVVSTDLSAINDYGNFIFVLAGFIITAIVQSSSMMVVIALSGLNAGAIGFEAAACLVIGSETGTAIKTVLASIGSDADKKRVALGNLLLNITASMAAFFMLEWLIMLIRETMAIQDPLIALVCFQSAINLAGIVIFFPVLKPFAEWLEKCYRDSDEKMSFYLNKLLLNDHETAVSSIEKEGRRLIQNIITLNKQALEIDPSADYVQLSKNVMIPQSVGKSYSEHYELVKHLNGEIIDFCLALKAREPEMQDDKKLFNLINMLRITMNAAKSMKDIRHNIKEYRDSANDTLHGIYKSIRESEEPFYTRLSELLTNSQDNLFKNLSELSYQNKKRHDSAMQEIFTLSSQSRLQDLELATLLNVFEGIRFSNESLINALIELNDLRVPDH